MAIDIHSLLFCVNKTLYERKFVVSVSNYHLSTNETTHNYRYDAIGQLVQDKTEEIENIEWTVTGKVKKIERYAFSEKPDLAFEYDPMGQRITKTVYPKSAPGVIDVDGVTKTYYVYDSQGNVMTVYTLKTEESEKNLYLSERMLYGSTRLGMEQVNEIVASTNSGNININTAQQRVVGDKIFELSNYLNSVMVTVTDRKLPEFDGSNNFTHYTADVVSYSDYYPFGMQMAERNGSAGDYRFGFGSHEKDDEISGSGNHLSFGDMGYDPRIVRRWRPDPFEKLYAPISPYAYALNSPIMFTDSDGNVVIGSDGKPVTYERGEDGVIKWSENATTDIIEVGNAMLSTDFGEKSFNKWQNASTKITITVDKNSSSNILGETKPTVGQDGNYKVNDDGQYEEAEIIFYKNKIDSERAEGSGKRFEGASYEETLGAVGTHEVYHNEPEQVKLDEKQPNEMQQKASKNLPINAEINFREEYHKKNPGLQNEETWKQNYEKYGYEGIKEDK